MKFCPRCGTKNADDATLCSMCRKPLPAGGATAPRVVPKPSPVPSPRPSSTMHHPHVSPVSHTEGHRATSSGKTGLVAWLSRFFGGRRAAEVDWTTLYTGVFRHHSLEDAEEIFAVGTPTTTPSPSSVSSTWPRPWLFSRVFLLFMATYALLYISVAAFPNAIPDTPNLMIVGSFAVPVSTLILFMELNVWKNISFYRVFQSFAIAGAASCIIALVVFSLFPPHNDWEGAIVAGIGEEIAKAILVLVSMKVFLKTPQRLLNGLLIGAAVGAGFGAFESAGYCFHYFLQANNFGVFADTIHRAGYLGPVETPEDPLKVMQTVILIRGILAPGGHVAYAALHGAALSIVARTAKLDASALVNPQFLRIAVFSVLAHIAWDCPILGTGPISYVKCAVLIAVLWLVVMILVHRGLDEVRHVYSRPAD